MASAATARAAARRGGDGATWKIPPGSSFSAVPAPGRPGDTAGSPQVPFRSPPYLAADPERCRSHVPAHRSAAAPWPSPTATPTSWRLRPRRRRRRRWPSATSARCRRRRPVAAPAGGRQPAAAAGPCSGSTSLAAAGVLPAPAQSAAHQTLRPARHRRPRSSRTAEATPSGRPGDAAGGRRRATPRWAHLERGAGLEATGAPGRRSPRRGRWRRSDVSAGPLDRPSDPERPSPQRRPGQSGPVGHRPSMPTTPRATPRRPRAAPARRCSVAGPDDPTVQRPTAAARFARRRGRRADHGAGTCLSAPPAPRGNQAPDRPTDRARSDGDGGGHRAAAGQHRRPVRREREA